MEVGVFVAVVSTIIGLIIGAVAGYYGGWMDNILMRITDLVLTLPLLVILLTAATLLGQGNQWRVSLILVFFFWTGIARVVRGIFLSLREKEYVEAAKASGAGDARLMFRHILPNTLGPIVVNATLAVGSAILIEAALSFLGFGIKPPTPSLGGLVNDGAAVRAAVVADGLPGPDDRPHGAVRQLRRRRPPRRTRSAAERSVPEPLLSIKDLVVEFKTEDGIVHAVDGVSYDLFPGETLGIVGESGSGKSVSTLALLGLIPLPPGRIASGTAMFKGQDLLRLKKRELRRVRGNEVAMVFQDPMTSLNPVLTVGSQLGEAIKTHFPKEKDEAVKHARHRAAEARGRPQRRRRATASTRTSSRAACASGR